MYFNKLKLADTGMECLIPFLQSLVNEDDNNLFSFVSMLLAKDPEYDMVIFSYQRSFPTAFFLLKG